MKKFLLKAFMLVMLMCVSGGAWAETVTETFEKQTAGTTYNGQITYKASDSNAGISWYVEHGTVSTSSCITGTKSMHMRAYYAKNSAAGTWNGALPYTETKTPIKGLQSFTFKAAVSNTGIKMDVYYSTDGSSWTQIGTTQTFSNTNAANAGTFDIPSSNAGTNYYIKIAASSSSTHSANPSSANNYTFRIDDVAFTYAAATTAYTVTFDGNGHGTPASASLTEASAGAGITLPGCTADAGYSFKGWADAADATSANIGVAGASYKPTDDVTLYAVYNSTHTVNIISPVGGTLAVKKGSVVVNDGDVLENGTTLTIEVTADDGYEYRNWQYKAGDAAWATRTSTYTYTIDGEDVTFRANFDRVSTADVILNFTDNSTWQFPEGSTNKTVDEDTFSDGTYDVVIAGSTGNGYYFNSDGYLLLGKKDAYLTLPTFPFAVEKIIVYGNSGASSTVGQNIYVGDVAVSTATEGAKTSNTYEIADAYQAAGNEYTLKVTTAANTQITSIEIYKKSLTISLNPDCTDGSLVYGTYSNASAWEVTDDIEVSEIGVLDGVLVVSAYKTGDVVPANTGVMVSSLTGGNFRVPVATGGTSKLGSDNCLRPTGNSITADAMAAADADSEFFRLTMHNGETIGFYWGAENGAAFALGANKAYLAVATDNLGLGGSARTGLWFGDNEEALESIEMNAATTIYTLDGVKVNELQKGLNIVNGKKVMVK